MAGRFKFGGTLFLGVLLMLACLAPAVHAAVPKRFFGIAPQTKLDSMDIAWMKKGGVDSLRTDVSWSRINPAEGVFLWQHLDDIVGLAAERRIEVLPFLYKTPRWVAPRETTLPVGTGEQRTAWKSFLRAAVERYGPSGDFWLEHGPGTSDPLPRVPIRNWQIWNEPNFFYFTTPASPRRYAKLVKISHPVLKSVDRGAKLILGGLFAHPKERYPLAMTAVKFLRAFYRVRGIKRHFEGVGVHPYAAKARRLPRTLLPLRKIMIRNRDRRTGLWITEMGWGSQGAGGTAFEKGPAGQVRQLRIAYRYLLRARKRLNLKRVYWFSWKDAGPGACSFCDSVGLFRDGPHFSPKPAWRAFTRFSGGSPAPPS